MSTLGCFKLNGRVHTHECEMKQYTAWLADDRQIIGRILADGKRVQNCNVLQRESEALRVSQWWKKASTQTRAQAVRGGEHYNSSSQSHESVSNGRLIQEEHVVFSV